MYVPLCVGGSKGKTGIQMWCIPEKRDTNNLYPGKWCHSLYRHNETTIDCGFEFVIKSCNVKLQEKVTNISTYVRHIVLKLHNM